jgi:mRNA interferase RelE/StbE
MRYYYSSSILMGVADSGYEKGAICSKLRFDSYCFSVTPFDEAAISMTRNSITLRAVSKQADASPDDIYDRVAVKIQQLAKDPHPDGVVKMQGSDSECHI